MQFRSIREGCHEVNIQFTLSGQDSDELTAKLGCYNSQDIIRDLCNICTLLANKLIIEATAILSHLCKEVNAVNTGYRLLYVASRVNAVLDDVRNEKQKNIPSKSAGGAGEDSHDQGGYGKIVEGKSEEKFTPVLRFGLTARLTP